MKLTLRGTMSYINGIYYPAHFTIADKSISFTDIDGAAKLLTARYPLTVETAKLSEGYNNDGKKYKIVQWLGKSGWAGTEQRNERADFQTWDNETIFCYMGRFINPKWASGPYWNPNSAIIDLDAKSRNALKAYLETFDNVEVTK